MPRWHRETPADLPWLVPRRDAFGMPTVQTQVLDASRATVIEGTTEKEELNATLREAQLKLDQFHSNERSRRDRKY